MSEPAVAWTITFDGEAWESFRGALEWPGQHRYIVQIDQPEGVLIDIELHGVYHEDDGMVVRGRLYDRAEGGPSGDVRDWFDVTSVHIY